MSAARISTTILASMWDCTRTSACIASYHGTQVCTIGVVPMVLEYHDGTIFLVPWYLGTLVQALVRVQAHMLARIVVEIRAADIAVELEPQL